jgi:hypothetical protein
MTNISIETHKLYAGDVGDVYTCFRDLLGIQDQISNDQLHQQVVDHYFHYKSEHHIVLYNLT